MLRVRSRAFLHSPLPTPRLVAPARVQVSILIMSVLFARAKLLMDILEQQRIRSDLHARAVAHQSRVHERLSRLAAYSAAQLPAGADPDHDVSVGRVVPYRENGKGGVPSHGNHAVSVIRGPNGAAAHIVMSSGHDIDAEKQLEKVAEWTEQAFSPRAVVVVQAREVLPLTYDDVS